MKIRIFALARELGLDSKVLLGLADEAGVKLRNALATITPEERDQIVAHVKGGSSPVPAEPKPEDLAPIREPHPGKVRDIKHIPDKVTKAEIVEEVAEEIEVEAEADAPVEPEAPPVVEEVAEVQPEAETSSPAETEDAPEPAPVVETKAEAEAVEPAAKSAPSPPTPPTPPAQPQKSASPMVRMGGPREMKPIGSIKSVGGGTKDTSSEKPGAKPPARPIGRPLVAAAPTFQPAVVKQKPKKDSEKAMKPVISLDSIVDTASPLAEQLKQLKHARDQHDGAAATPGKRGPKTGSLIEGLRRAREEQRSQKKQRRRKRTSNVALKTSAQIAFPITVRNLSEAIGRPAKSIMGYFFRDGRMVTINDELGEEEALEVSMELGVDLEIKRGRDIEVELLQSLDHEDDEDTLEWRPPIVTILGHVDHGKTTLVDKLRLANVAAGEAGGITQHIAAYQIERNGQPVTFVDTPGHAAFGGMRARGANVTDIIVLVIAVNDGIMPQTEECISHAKNAGVPIIIALNKMDLPDVDDQRVLQQLAQHELLPSEWGGEYEVIRTSGETGLGLDDLIETIQLTAELHNYQTNPDREALGVCLESFRDEGRGVIAWLIVQKGTLRVGDNVLCGTTYGRIRAIYNDNDEEIEEAGPSMPVKVTGLNEVPTSGVHFFAMKDIEEARGVAETRIHEGREESLSKKGQPKTITDILASGREGEGPQTLPVIIKADTPGSLEAIRGELDKFDHEEVLVKIIHEGVGGVNESDVYLASAGGAIIIAFHVVAEDRAALLADNEGVEVRRYNIIYEVTEHIRQSLEGMLRPERVEVATGRAIVLQTFSISRFGTIAGCRVLNGTISRDNRVHVIRDNTVLNNYRLASLKREKDDAKDVRDGMECGIRLDGFNDVKEGDILEAFRVDQIQRKLE